MRPPIYTPSGAALEYASFGLNIYDSCPHGCTYCYARDMAKRFGKPWSGTVSVRPGLLEALHKQLSRPEWQNAGRLIHLCFTCDPYPLGYNKDGRRINTMATREIIQAIKESGNHVQILTKGHTKNARRDFDLLNEHDSFGVTLSGAGWEQEPGAVNVDARIRILRDAATAGIPTWVSCEPVINAENILQHIKDIPFVDLWRIGKLNHRSSSINWREFGHKAKALCEESGRTCVIKNDLLKEMEGQ